MDYNLKQSDTKQSVWILYYDACYSDKPKFGGVFSSHAKALEAADLRKNPFITRHLVDRKES